MESVVVVGRDSWTGYHAMGWEGVREGYCGVGGEGMGMSGGWERRVA